MPTTVLSKHWLENFRFILEVQDDDGPAVHVSVPVHIWNGAEVGATIKLPVLGSDEAEALGVFEVSL